ncbi:MAG: Na+/H+ antiporter NhaA [Saprospiraceae bacterium]|nr:Na+/H+ antiporter NhaA [Saprospiraceae bacterium]
MIRRLTKLFDEFFQSEKAGGYLLMGCAALAVVLANSSVGDAFLNLWKMPLPGGAPLEWWINDGLMAVFFLLVGLEIERELYIGELSDWRNALVPLMAAVGGMAVPAIVFLAYNNGLPTVHGFGIPMATDIAFAIGVMGLLGNRVPIALKVFLTALAIIDDLGAILVIALFYSHGFSFAWFAVAVATFAVMMIMGYRKVYSLWPYLLGFVVLWYALHHAGIHATIAGVLTAFAIPFGHGEKGTPSYDLQHFLHHPVAFFIIPVFALANAGLKITPEMTAGLYTPLGMGILVGLVWGKPFGVLLGVMLGRSIGGREASDNVSWWQYTGAGMMAGIGFTMSIFITLLALHEPAEINVAKGAIFLASLVAGILGFVVLRVVGTRA